MTPRAERVSAEPAPDGGSADLGNQTLRQHLLPDLRHGEPGQRQSQAVGQLTGEGFNLDDETGGKSGPFARLGVDPQGRGDEPAQTVYATY